ncbi:MAG: 5'-methylthioadenosine/S-adenosylhomocysteine nucleosidase [Firmicutes bacterium]|nr:5'-methylthioadenosine/S-adenosylhomocysteine nucleosidase [Bacillota bacterium]
MIEQPKIKTVIIISSDTEWKALGEIFPEAEPLVSPYGQWFFVEREISRLKEPVVFFHGGWGKISAAASTQYVIDRWSPKLLVNLGTCGGFEGEIEKSTIILAERTIVYDIIEQMLDFDEAIACYATDIDLSWIGENYPQDVRKTLLVSGDRDLRAEDITGLKSKYSAVAGDWESGAIAWVACRNNTRCLILRGVTDLVGSSGGEAYEGNFQVYAENAGQILKKLIHHLPEWIEKSF